MSLIIIIDASPAQGRLFEQSMAGLRHRLLITQSAVRGVELAQSGNPDLILISPDEQIDGIQILGTLRRDPITREIAVALMQKAPNPAILPRLKQLGVVEIIEPGTAAEPLRGKLLSALLTAEKQKLTRNLKRANHIQVKRQHGRTDIILLSGLKDYAVPEARTVLNPFFLKLIKDDTVILDIRAIPNIPETDVRLLEEMIASISSPRIHLLAGRHLGLLVSETDLAMTLPLFFSVEELEKHLSTKRPA